MTGVEISRVHHPVTTLGYGRRAGIWFQGCTIGCPGCVSRDTWPATPERAVDVDVLLRWLAELPEPLDGLTVSGGEPFQQPKALRELLTGVRSWASGRPTPFDLLVYSGYAVSRLRRDRLRSTALDLCDAVVAGPYVERLNVGQRWQGSGNQRLIPLTSLGRERYARIPDGGPALQVHVEDGRVWAVGIPRRGDMLRMEEWLRAAGVTFEEVSWRG
jgi:anaerobic ribonucleoside-triphosphate reductase activating protein